MKTLFFIVCAIMLFGGCANKPLVYTEFTNGSKCDDAGMSYFKSALSIYNISDKLTKNLNDDEKNEAVYKLDNAIKHSNEYVKYCALTKEDIDKTNTNTKKLMMLKEYIKAK